MMMHVIENVLLYIHDGENLSNINKLNDGHGPTNHAAGVLLLEIPY